MGIGQSPTPCKDLGLKEASDGNLTRLSLIIKEGKDSRALTSNAVSLIIIPSADDKIIGTLGAVPSSTPMTGFAVRPLYVSKEREREFPAPLPCYERPLRRSEGILHFK
jgi:hypothetical protein